MSIFEKDQWHYDIDKAMDLVSKAFGRRGQARYDYINRAKDLMRKQKTDWDEFYSREVLLQLSQREKITELRHEVLQLTSQVKRLMAQMKSLKDKPAADFSFLDDAPSSIPEEDEPVMEPPSAEFLSHLACAVAAREKCQLEAKIKEHHGLM